MLHNILFETVTLAKLSVLESVLNGKQLSIRKMLCSLISILANSLKLTIQII